MAPLRTLAVLLAAAFALAPLAPGAAPAVAAGPAADPATGPATTSAAAKGAGATFPQPVYARWAALFAAEGGGAVSYEGTDSGAGLRAVQTGNVTFGASDTPIDEALQKAASIPSYFALVQIPTLVGGIVPVVDLPGVGPGDLVLDGRTLADMFMGRIGFWDDPAIVGRNPHLPLPHLAVTAVRRSDASGTSAVFAAYLARVSKGEQAWLGESPPRLPPVGVGAEGSDGVAKAVSATPGAIGYVGFDYAQVHHLIYADLVNPAGRVVQPTLASIAAAAAEADWSRGLTPSLVAGNGGASWPIVSATYVLMRRVNNEPDAAKVALHFLAWAGRAGGSAAEDLGFVPLPDAVSAAVRDRLREVGDASGRPLVPAP